jgi:hypothetical protein
VIEFRQRLDFVILAIEFSVFLYGRMILQIAQRISLIVITPG